MEEIQLNPVIFPAALLVSLLILLWSVNRWSCKAAANINSPPSPPKLPIIGNLYQLGSLPQHDLHSLAQKHGPLMLLHLGSVPALIVSSADAAREVLRTHDLAFANRPLYKVFRKLLYDGKDVAFSPHGEYWRQMRIVVDIHLLCKKRVQSFRSIREEETALSMKKIGESSGPVNLSKMFDELTNDGICRAAFGRKYSQSEEVKKFLLLLFELIKLLGNLDIGDFIPWLSWISHVNGVDKRMNEIAKIRDDIIEGMIEERIEIRKAGQAMPQKNGENFIDIMLDIYNDNIADVSIDRDGIKALIFDVFVAGTDAVSATLEWAMTELLRHPTVMKKLQKEIKEITKDKQDIRDEDLEKMHYLKAVIKETFRYHPPVPLLVPRLATKDVKIKGYDIQAGTVVMINARAIGRDPLCWDEPEKFEPERFLNSSIDFKGLDFELIPFGAGVRKCPGITYANATIEFVLANLVQKFNWELPNGAQGKDLDMNEAHGISVRKVVPLLAVASPSQNN